MGTCTVSIKKRTGLAPTGKCVIADITLSSSYATGGDTIDPKTLELTSIDAVILSGASPTSGVVLAFAPGATNKLKAYQDVTPAATAPLPEVAAATNLSTHVVRAVIYGDLPNI